MIPYVAKAVSMKVLDDRDKFTGALSRDALMHCLAARDSNRGAEPVAELIAFMGIDNFKAFNAHNGHPLGDEVLNRLVAQVSKMIRSDDRLFRYGGDTFVIVFAQSDRKAVLQLLEQICVFARKDLSPPQQANCGDSACRGPTALSASIGVSELINGMSAAQWLENAEERMYVAKRMGRDRVCI